MDPDSLTILTEEKLPRKSNIHIFNTEDNDASGGGYLHMTPSEQVIVPRMDKKIAFYRVINTKQLPYKIGMNPTLFFTICPGTEKTI